MVHYAAASQKIELLPGCPFPGTLEVARALSRIPRISSLSNVDDLTTSIKKLAHPAEKLLSWACLSYGGFLVSATGKMRIPGMPANTHQFLLASARPDLEAAFQSRFGSGPTRVLWHGTYMERLFAILSEGLKICSHTTLQLHGAASGAGIYTATEPGTSWGYSAAPAANWSGSTIKGVRVLLGLEAAGGASASTASTVHVVTDVQSLMVRYVFLVPSTAVIPAAANVAPAMLSAYSSLRSGVL
ncbi:hypothetical protein B0O99DRAFT_636601 [Bisporella sp. PMI_857]|nr:hypothetical protein B0O99DRAFT_636601 [Bisporella sp. PMI_857]